jgi:predicted transcriptional regulator
MKKLIENIKNNLNLHESAEKFVEAVDKNKLDQKEDYKPLLTSFCDVLREKGYPTISENFAEKWHMK